MCNLSDAIELRGIQKGREEGYREGYRQGYRQGYEQGYEFEVWLGRELRTDKSIEQIMDLGIKKGKELKIKEDVKPWIRESIEERFRVYVNIVATCMKELNLSLDEALANFELKDWEERAVRFCLQPAEEGE